MKKPYILALDQGTTSSRSIVFDGTGNIAGEDHIEFRQIFPQPGWVEHDPMEIWQTQVQTARNAVHRAGLSFNDIAGIGITNQRETAVFWERASGQPVYNAIVWQCRRSREICDQLVRAGYSEMVRAKTGLVMDAYFSASKISWLWENCPQLEKRAQNGEICFGTIDSWLIYNLTGNHFTDPSNASRTMLFNIHTMAWDRELLEIFKVPQAMLPQVKPNSFIFGHTKQELFGRSLPVAGAAGDQQAALCGQACFDRGDAKHTYGTGGFLLANTGSTPVISHNNLLSTVAWQLGGLTTYALEGSVFVAGAVISWLRDKLAIIKTAAASEQLAESVADTGGVFFVPAFVGLGAPYWDSEARGTLVGLTRGTERAHLVRAALESIAFQSNDLIVCMENDLGKPLNQLKADGGASANVFLMQFQADISRKKLVLSQTAETTALGAAYLAGLAVGVWNNFTDIKKQWRESRVFVPAMEDSKRNYLLETWQRAVSTARAFI